MATMPHCDQRVLHAPGTCEYCDEFPEWQRARLAWGIAFTSYPPTDKQPLPCPSEARRDVDTINRWPGNRPAPKPGEVISVTTSEPLTIAEPTGSFASVEDWWSAHSPTQLGRPNIPVLRKDLEAMVREIIRDVLREERGR